MFFLLNFDLLEMLLSMCTESIKRYEMICVQENSLLTVTEVLARRQVNGKPLCATIAFCLLFFVCFLKLLDT